nr:hypothetical protein [Saprospiraceae bacterium]
FQPDPIPCGHKQEQPLHLQPHHAVKKGSATFTGWKGLTGERLGTHPTGVDGDWIVDWQSKYDTITWHINVVEERNYRIGVHLRSGLSQSFGLTLLIDSVPRITTVESAPSTYWHFYELGVLPLEKGEHRVALTLDQDLAESIALQNLMIKWEMD